MKKSARSLSVEGSRIDQRQYRSTNPLGVIKSILRALFSGGSIMAPHRVYSRKK
jgi:hypothetical protein